MTEGTIKNCPFCAEEILAAAVVCKHCRKDLPIQKQKAKSVSGKTVLFVFAGLAAIIGWSIFAPHAPSAPIPCGRILNSYVKSTDKSYRAGLQQLADSQGCFQK